MNQMSNTVTKGELVALQAVIEDWGNRHGTASETKSEEDRDRLRVARRAIAKIHKLFKQGALKDQLGAGPGGIGR